MSWEKLPDWYPELRAARYLGITVEQLRQRPVIEMERALLASLVEEETQTFRLAKIMGLLK